MKLLFWIPALGGRGGGAERVLSIVASGLAQRGHDVVVASADRPGNSELLRVRSRCPASVPRRKSRRVLAPCGAGCGCARSSCAIRPDVAIGFMFAGYATLAAAAAGTGVPVVASEHTAFDHYRRRGVQARLLRSIPRRFSAFTIPSERVRLGYPPSVADRMTVIPNPLPKMVSDRRDPRANDERKRLLAVGNLREEKGHSVLIEAFSRIATDHPDWELRIVRGGSAQERPRAGDRNTGPEGTGRKSRESSRDIAAEYAAANLFVMPSSYESFGLATAEALASGLPAVGFADCPGTSEIIQDGVNGLLVQGPDRAEALAAGLSRLMGEPALLAEFSSRAPLTVADYEAEGIVMRWEELLQSVVSNADARK